MPHRLRHPSQPQPRHQLPGQPSRGTALHHEVRGALRLLKRAVLRSTSASPPAEAISPVPGRGGMSAGLVAASYNVHRCIGVDQRFNPGRVAAVIEELDADIVALQEADRRFGHRAGLLELGDVERRTGLALVPVSPTPGGHGWRGNALLVRGGHATQVRRLSLPGAEPRGALIVDLAMPQGPLRVAAAHLGLLRRHRAMQAAAILSALEGLAPMPTLLLGDLNEWRSGTHSSLAGLEPLFGPFLHPQQPSFPSRLPFLALDQIMGHPHGLVMPPQVHDTPLARMASDHLPLRAGIDMAFGQGAAAVSEAA